MRRGGSGIHGDGLPARSDALRRDFGLGGIVGGNFPKLETGAAKLPRVGGVVGVGQIQGAGLLKIFVHTGGKIAAGFGRDDQTLVCLERENIIASRNQEQHSKRCGSAGTRHKTAPGPMRPCAGRHRT
jgi:hypothetical protein